MRIPLGAQRTIARWWPWITSAALVGIAFAWPLLSALGGLARLGAEFRGGREEWALSVVGFAFRIQIALAAVALPGLFVRRLWGFIPACAARVVGAFVAIVHLAFLRAPIDIPLGLGYLVFNGLELWVLFEIRGLYTGLT